MSGPTTKARLVAGGVTVRAGVDHGVLLTDIWFPPLKHPLHHKRGEDPIDEELVSSIIDEGQILEPITVREDGAGKDGKIRLTLIDGARRTVNGLEAERRMRASGALKEDQFLFPKVRFFKGSDAEALRERLRLNTDPLKKPDAPSAVAAILIVLERLREPLEAALAACPRWVTPKIGSALLRWPNLSVELAARFDSGEVPIGLLPAVLDATPEDREAVLGSLLAAGVKDPKGATMVKNREAKREKGGADAVVRRPHPNTAAKVAAHLDGVAPGGAAGGFLAGVRWMLGEDMGEVPAGVVAALEAAREKKKAPKAST